MEISVIIPTHNESARIGGTLRRLEPFLKKRRGSWEILVVDDGTDATAAIARKFAKTRVLHYPRRLGKGGAVMEGLRKARGRVVLLYDADAAAPASEIPKLLAALGGSDVAIGCRYCRGAKAEMSALRRLIGTGFNLLVRFLFCLPFEDTQCGFKAAKRASIAPILAGVTEKGFVWDVDFLYACKNAGLRVAQVPIRWRQVEGGPAASGGALGVLGTATRMFRDLLALRLSRF
ncbi:hypothetical protein COX86_02335 [Candidatus Micrarchaeota archaeon CG_4_10_14_0_2_um_filter_60_11]|nr:MAG: hypothetical protein AUJ16_02885 [Candidatus Micrarchaeota archaeon CG1_02_60_51]PIN95893.1 MAG: hypothetical protein COU39_03580 [Candidatus Micrarchaeota archaeon CG10_big_fil_rev_8_21_14_0_10_60_32]PIO01922.1 MAG: hypothetical protein COT58_02665 [Candidatus Micrarchaeota archaeon CG09_land_8_20_14_0_10_60_16]PIY91546.1 MAG: hypothetical protein COY71_02575 [Candidatus Micrarchaeota archaeon CG_4_10_14_0_8_um_filter_60_7]PIZ90957.1 MAG: hypothetical protein COX86_02335 [Candidatus Mi